MDEKEKLKQQGWFFAEKQMGCSNRLISWTHGKRFEIADRIMAEFKSVCLLDYGCGDGTFLARLIRSGNHLEKCIGAEIDDQIIKGNQERFDQFVGDSSRVQFLHNRELDCFVENQESFDTIVCMEVMEHVVNFREVLQDFTRWLTPKGRLIVSVPIETGLPLIIKQIVRKYAGWRGVGDYPGLAPYTWKEFFKGVIAGGSRPHIERPIHKGGFGTFHCHKGFNWKVLRKEISNTFHIERTFFSPVGRLGAQFASQVWFVARKNQE